MWICKKAILGGWYGAQLKMIEASAEAKTKALNALEAASDE